MPVNLEYDKTERGRPTKKLSKNPSGKSQTTNDESIGNKYHKISINLLPKSSRNSEYSQIITTNQYVKTADYSTILTSKRICT